MRLDKFTIGIGDRFAHQAKAQLAAFIAACDRGAELTPVWNKSNREHDIVGSQPVDVRAAAEAAVKALGWDGAYHIDADHINLGTVDRYLAHSDFFTIDVADQIGKACPSETTADFVGRHPELIGDIRIAGIESGLTTTSDDIASIAGKYLKAVEEAGRIYRHIREQKGGADFATEISMDETDSPQTPVELLVILAAIADEKIPVQTIAPKFTGRFNKGVDYQGDLAAFEREFNDDLAIIAHAVATYGLPDTLKLSVHSGSDKFSLYPVIREAIRKHDAGLHLKTAGTTWLEELTGLAEAGGDGLALAKEIYTQALAKSEELSAPYASVIDIDPNQLPDTSTVDSWSADDFTAALRHDQKNPNYNPHFRQLLHIGFKIAAQMGKRYTDALVEFEPVIAKNVKANLLERHLAPLFFE